MPYDNSERQATYDYITGSATGYAYNAHSAIGASLHRAPSAPAMPTSPGSNSAGSPAGFSTTYADPTLLMTKEQKKAYRAKQRERTARDRDEFFKNLLGWAFLGAFSYLDYLYLPVMEWWAHIPVVLIPTLISVWVISKLGLTRILRRTAIAAVALACVYGALVFSGTVPPIEFS